MRKILCWLGLHEYWYGTHIYSGVKFNARHCQHCKAVEPLTVELT